MCHWGHRNRQFGTPLLRVLCTHEPVITMCIYACTRKFPVELVIVDGRFSCGVYIALRLRGSAKCNKKNKKNKNDSFKRILGDSV